MPPEDVPDIGIDDVLPDIGVEDVLPDIGADEVEFVPVAGAGGVVGRFAESAVGEVGSGGVTFPDPGVAGTVGVVGESVACAKAFGAAAASMAATAPASAKRCSVVRVDMGGKAPFC